MTTLTTHSVSPNNPSILDAPGTLRLRCTRHHGCPFPGCGKLLLSIRLDTGEPPSGLTLVRECPRRKSILCEFRPEEALPTNKRR